MMKKLVCVLSALCMLFLMPTAASAHHKDGHEQGPGVEQVENNGRESAPGQQKKEERQDPAPQPQAEEKKVEAEQESAPAANNKNDKGANQDGPYDSTEPDGESQGKGNAPEDGSKGKADDKNPPGQVNNDKDRGYECDDNKGVGKGNPAHTGCDDAEEPVEKDPKPKPPVDKPDKPQKPKPPVDKPETPEKPEVPEKPETPEEPEEPVVPGPPVITPEEPETPVLVPETPVFEKPEEPARPFVPTPTETIGEPEELAYTGANSALLLMGAASMMGAGSVLLRKRR